MIEVRAQLRQLRMSPKKVRVLANSVKGMAVSEALARLRFIPKASSPVLSKLVRSAVANAQHNNNLKQEDLFIKSIIVNEGVAMKRWRPAAFGSAHPFKRRSSHVTVVLGLQEAAAKKLSEKQTKRQARSKKEAKPSVPVSVKRALGRGKTSKESTKSSDAKSATADRQPENKKN